MNYKKFVRTWMVASKTGQSTGWVAAKNNLRNSTAASNRAARLRKAGVNLPNLVGGVAAVS